MSSNSLRKENMTKQRTKTAWERKCEAVSKETGVDVQVFGDIATDDDAYEDDGNLHIERKGKPRACFSIGEWRSVKVQNERIRAVMNALELEVTDRVRVEQECI